MSICTVAQAARMAGGTLLSVDNSIDINAVMIDSREVAPGTLFVALPGERVDGHDFIKQAFENGAVAAMVAESHAQEFHTEAIRRGVALIVVDDPLRGLQRFASAHVARFPEVRKVGITGSCGKTTTKDMVASVLSMMGNTASTPGNLNSEIGLPLSVFQVGPETEYGVFEMGVDHVGEMDRMLDIWRPDAGIITNIGLSHLGKMGSMRVIAHEKSKMFHDRITTGLIVENCAWSGYISDLRKISLSPFGLATTEGVNAVESLGLRGWKIDYEGISIHLEAIGKHNLVDAMAAITLARNFGADRQTVKEGLERFRTSGGRSRIIQGDVTIIEDCYNASMDSTGNILDYMGTIPWKGKKKVVLGSMKELGSASVAAHEAVGRKLLGVRPSSAYFYGKEMESAWTVMKQNGYTRDLFYTDDFEELQAKVMQEMRRGDLVLLKGSRAMAMERLVPGIRSIA
ncbi:MAG: UDP-N-acetylmuramoylalanyl-D-glutamate--2,6-diaminopimelate ligase [Spirochaetae bacterium HGW-Spirochaetae-8]|nr:MAG: UDP-N-acetylmuramoylalanyl-D-glutamate--2,6-diaminopimelate ligase [Spirochaetae bacterium HGW-Spirochaetae-8]